MTAFQTDAAEIAIAFIRLTIAAVTIVNSGMRTGRCGVNYYERK